MTLVVRCITNSTTTWSASQSFLSPKILSSPPLLPEKARQETRQLRPAKSTQKIRSSLSSACRRFSSYGDSQVALPFRSYYITQRLASTLTGCPSIPGSPYFQRCERAGLRAQTGLRVMLIMYLLLLRSGLTHHIPRGASLCRVRH